MSNKKTITVTQPQLPPLEEFLPSLRQIWESKVLTNNGPFHKKFEAALCEYLGVPYVALFTNATIALITALKSLHIAGEVITTPYSFVATAHSLLWNDIKPVFVDIDPGSMNLDPAKIEAAITSKTTAILPVHCYGRPCDLDAIQRIADKYNLRVIYDAAHAFGVRQQGRSILTAGDISVLSFHATKVFNTFEGGAIICPDARTKEHIDQLKNFGFVNELCVEECGINGKMSEFNAALGLLQLQHIDLAMARRSEIDALYRRALGDVQGLRLSERPADTQMNQSYFPVLVQEDFALSRDGLYSLLKESGIHCRRYFYPLISEFSMYRGLPSTGPDKLPNAHRIASQVICLPIYPDLEDEDVLRVIAVIRDAGGDGRV